MMMRPLRSVALNLAEEPNGRVRKQQHEQRRRES